MSWPPPPRSVHAGSASAGMMASSAGAGAGARGVAEGTGSAMVREPGGCGGAGVSPAAPQAHAHSATMKRGRGLRGMACAMVRQPMMKPGEAGVTRGSANRRLQWYEALGINGLLTGVPPGAASKACKRGPRGKREAMRRNRSPMTGFRTRGSVQGRTADQIESASVIGPGAGGRWPVPVPLTCTSLAVTGSRTNGPSGPRGVMPLALSFS